jgi:hypothetical protein
MRLLLAVIGVGLVLIGGVAVVVASGDDGAAGLSPAVGAAVVAAVGVAGWLLSPRLGGRLDCSSAERLVRTYRSRFMVRLAVAEAASLVAFVMVLLTYEPLIYLLGLAFSAAGFARVAPTAGRLARDQDALAISGCAQSLVAVLGAPPT